jgi:hypothetical protein
MSNPKSVFVAWQSPSTRGFFPVGRLSSFVGEDGRQFYEFAYTHGATEAHESGFRPFLSFPDLNEVYRSQELFPLFANRLMSSKRPDYPEYINRLGLDIDIDQSLGILARSGGSRSTDTLELFPSPETTDSGYVSYFFSHGIRYLPPEAQERIERLDVGDTLLMMFDSQNKVDTNAMALRTEDMHIVGYVPRYLLHDTRELVALRDHVEFKVERVNPVPAPLQQRLLVRIDACWPDNFVPFSSRPYQPLNADANLA